MSLTPEIAKKIYDLLEMAADLPPEALKFIRETSKRPFRELYPEDIGLLQRNGIALQPLIDIGIVKKGQIMEYKIDLLAVAEAAQKVQRDGGGRVH